MQIWQIADKENRGFLTPAGFGLVLRLIGHAQAGREPTAELALQQGPLPRFDGFTPTPAPPAPPALQAQGTGASGPIRIPPLLPEKVAQYAGLFERQPLQNGMLPGEAAKQIFEKSGLPNEILGRIWMLVDTEQRGALALTEFVIAMHLLTSMKTGALRGLPSILPAALYEAATRRAPVGGAGIPRQQSPTAATSPPMSAVPRQLTGQGPLPQMRTGSPLGRPPVGAQTTGDWLITAADKARFDQLFDELDKAKKGFITGEEAVPFFSQSNLSEDILAQIWDLADIHSEGRLSRDEFAVAMYLIRQQRSKRDGSVALPATLPPNLVPPSMRAQPGRPTTAPLAAAFEPSPRPQPKPSALDDLFGLDDVHPPAPAQVAVGTGGSAGGDPFATSVSPAAPSSPSRPSPSASAFKPFVPSSSFGRGLTAQVTGGSNTSAPAKAAAAEDDLLGDTEPEVSKNLNNETTELANLSNQIGSLTKQVQDVQAQRTATQNELSQASIQKKNFEQRLAQLRAMYEKEAQDVRSLETQLTTSKNETKKLQAEFAMIDASYQELQNQHRQILTALQADQQENANLKEKIKTVNAEIAQLKPQIEKLKSEARQQKGLVAINKKQLATNEAERDKLKAEAEDLARSNEELARQISASSSQGHAQVASPALSTASANNPFFRRTGSTDIAATFSPPIRSFTDKTFDDVFGPGPVGPGSQTGTPPAPAAAAVFKQNTGTSTGSVGSFATPGSASPNLNRQPAHLAESAPAEAAGRSTNNFPQFGDAAESLSTSRQVSPPLSQTEANQDAQSSASPMEPARTGQSFASGSGSEAARAASPASETKAAPSAFAPIAEEPSKTPATGTNAPSSFVVDQDKAKEDFESAFASFKQARAATSSSADTAKAFSTFNTEFPPISELERDDESDSESERGGFDDDFAPASPPSKPAEEAQSRSASPNVSKSAPDTGAAAASAAAAEPASSENPVPTTTASTTGLSNLSSSNVDDIFGAAAGSQPAAAASSASRPTTAATATKGAFDDLDDDFEGLEDAKEGSADDDFANISRSGLDDFNPVFDSSPPPSQPKSDSGPVFGTESSFDFASLSTASAAGSTAGAASLSSPSAAGHQAGSASAANAKPSAAQAAAESHDWDALFAGLESAATPTASSHTLAGGDGQPEDQQQQNQQKQQEQQQQAARPAPGRALTEDGEHDDPLLKNLTGMGYARKDALAALEKYDYNLERAANYLASQS
ncbi:uncharacterized protein THITE_2124731 [Thermothielavioides terrestris NRRL 8126]|uniref:Uncharacterized protein n=1 Tax=Thermothielavioides terrestris (strain ATCC 38088 / NRRL 8126) TaxID=578455 RepID=G2RGH2_THETT|nr:uncharacterized protein THITE_2124731 [Thermothielavioides terrestris NRRL 8126]AEO71861.1 hypothetical protein THITE_2124731 [Thermothielavioides terrestris NRRL 8126]